MGENMKTTAWSGEATLQPSDKVNEHKYAKKLYNFTGKPHD
jgi:hypothetical protein